MVYTYFITGGNRGIGLELVRQFSSRSNTKVIVSVRDVSKAVELKKLQSEESRDIEIVRLDYGLQESIDSLGEQLEKAASEGIDFFISNAGVGDSFSLMSNEARENFVFHYTTNVLGSIFVFRAVKPFLLKKSTRIVSFTSSALGSIGDYKPYACAAYGQSKAALNYSAKALSHELAPEGFIVILTEPGAVNTDLFQKGLTEARKSLPAALADAVEARAMTPEYSCSETIKNVFDKVDKSMTGKLYRYTGEEQIF